MPLPAPIRYDRDTWLIMRSDPALPKAIVYRYRSRDGGEVFALVKWDLDVSRRVLMGIYDSLDKANALVRFDAPAPSSGVPKGREAFGAYSGPS